MFGWGSSQSQGGINKLLSDPSTKLETVFSDRMFNNMLRNQNEKLIEFLTRDDNITRMVEYTLSDVHKNEPDVKKSLSTSVVVLTSEAEKLCEKLSQSKVYLSAIKSFRNTEYAKNSFFCGYYATLVEALAKATNGEVLGSKLGFLAGYLIKNLNILGLRQLFITLVINFGVPFRVSSRMMQSLVDQLKVQNQAIFVAMTIKDIITKEPDMRILLESGESMEMIMKVALENYHTFPALSTLLFQVVSIVVKNSERVTQESIAEKYEKEIDFLGPVNCATPSALILFPNNYDKFIERFLKSELPTILNEAITSIINGLSIDDLQKLATSFHLSEMILKHFKQYKRNKINGHFLSLMRTFADKGICCCDEHQESWSNFTKNKMAKRYLRVMMEYGGHITEESKGIQRDLFMSIEDLYSASMDLSSILADDLDENDDA